MDNKLVEERQNPVGLVFIGHDSIVHIGKKLTVNQPISCNHIFGRISVSGAVKIDGWYWGKLFNLLSVLTASYAILLSFFLDIFEKLRISNKLSMLSFIASKTRLKASHHRYKGAVTFLALKLLPDLIESFLTFCRRNTKSRG